jgi:hypothetical protein
METIPTASTQRSLDQVSKEYPGRITFKDFDSIIRVYPHLMYPAFRLQVKIKEVFMGVTYWDKKRDTMSKTRDKLRELRKAADRKIYWGKVVLHFLLWI